MGRRVHNAFTLIELVVVIGVLAVVIAAFLGISRTVIAKSQVQETSGLLTTIDMAIKQFKQDKPLANVPNYKNRFAADYPPDELEAFTDPAVGYSPSGASFFQTNLSPGNGELLGTSGTLDLANVTNRDVKAMALAIQLFSPEATALLDRIDSRYRRSVKDDITGGPGEYFQRIVGGNTVQIPLIHYVDSWDQPIQYYSLCHDFGAGSQEVTTLGPNPPSDRRLASTFFVHANSGEAFVMSYGPDGPDQVGAGAVYFDLVTDFNEPTSSGQVTDYRNDDNVYLNPLMRDKLAKGTR